SSLITPLTMISESNMPSSRYSKLLPVLMAAKPTPKVMPMKYLPSRVSLRRRGGRKRAYSRRRRLAFGGSGRRSDFCTLGCSESRPTATASSLSVPCVGVPGHNRQPCGSARHRNSQRRRDAGDDVAQRGLSLFSTRDVALCVGGQAHA